MSKITAHKILDDLFWGLYKEIIRKSLPATQTIRELNVSLYTTFSQQNQDLIHLFEVRFYTIVDYEEAQRVYFFDAEMNIVYFLYTAE